MVYLFWLFDLAVIGLSVLAVLFSVTLAVFRDPTPGVILPFICTLTIHTAYYAPYAPYLYGIAGAVLFLGIVIRLVRFPPCKRGLSPFALATGILLLSLCLSGLGAGTAAPIRLVVIGLALFIFTQTLFCKTADPSFVLYAVCLASLLAAAQFITLLFQIGPEAFFATKNLPGATSANQYANLMARSLPVLFFLSVGRKKGSFLWLVPTFFLLAVIALSNSRATILVSALTVICAFVRCVIKSPRRGAFLLTFFLLAILSLLLVLQRGVAEKVFAVIMERKLNDYHRFELWQAGLSKFLRYPLFGAGLADNMGVGINDSTPSFAPFWYHNTFVQALASFGAFGLLALLVFLSVALFTAFSSRDRRGAVAGCIFLLILAISMLDVHFYTPQTLWQTATLIAPFSAKKIFKRRIGAPETN